MEAAWNGGAVQFGNDPIAGVDPDLPDDICKVEVGFLIFKLPVGSSG